MKSVISAEVLLVITKGNQKAQTRSWVHQCHTYTERNVLKPMGFFPLTAVTDQYLLSYCDDTSLPYTALPSDNIFVTLQREGKIKWKT